MYAIHADTATTCIDLHVAWWRERQECMRLSAEFCDKAEALDDKNGVSTAGKDLKALQNATGSATLWSLGEDFYPERVIEIESLIIETPAQSLAGCMVQTRLLSERLDSEYTRNPELCANILGFLKKMAEQPEQGAGE